MKCKYTKGFQSLKKELKFYCIYLLIYSFISRKSEPECNVPKDWRRVFGLLMNSIARSQYVRRERRGFSIAETLEANVVFYYFKSRVRKIV